ELYFIKTRDVLYARNAAGDYPALPEAAPQRLLTTGPVNNRYTIKDTLSYWKLAGQIEEFVDAYGSGHYDEAEAALSAIASAKSD
ncbi:MAG TPA: hypothetical protein VFE38_15365, partial [Edaphobacter sp.]|nr:hypothetical protein [Edaphobacter sp.]